MTDEYKQYEVNTKVRVIETGEIGEAFESLLGFITVFIGEDGKCRYYRKEDIEFIDD